MLICPNCGTANTDDSKFCEGCGTKLEGVARQAPGGSEEINAQPAAEPENAPNMEPDGGPAAEPTVEPGAEPAEEQTEPAMGPEPEQWQPEHADQGYDPNMGQSFEQNMPQGFDQDFTQNMAAGGAPRKKMSRLQLAVILEAACLVLLIVVFFAVGNSRSSAGSVAEKYFKAYVDQDWEEAYSMLEIPEGTFIQEDQYEQIMDASEQPEITNFQVQESVGDVEDGITRTFTVNYSINGQGQSSTTVTVVRQSRKSMLFFDTWKVSADGLIAQDYSIYVPQGAQAAVDGVQLTEEQLSGDSEGMDCYQISIFNGTHSIQVEAPWFETYEGQFDTLSQGEYTVSGLSLSDDGEQAVESKLQEALQAYYQAALAGKSFDEVKDLFAEGAADSNEDAYDRLRDDLEATDYSAPKQIQFSGFRCQVYDGDSYNGSLQAELEYDYNVSYTYTYTYSGRTEDRTNDGSSYADARFVYDGDTYKLLSFDPGYVWY